MRVLVTSIGSTPSIGVVKFIKDLKRDTTIIGTDINAADRIAGSAFVDECIKVPLNKDPGYIAEMLRIAEEKKIDILIPIHDHEIEVLSESADSFKKIGCTVIVSAYTTVKNVNNKYAFAKLLAQSNILTPETFAIEAWSESDFPESDPWILKPLQGVSSRGIYKGNTIETRSLIEQKGITSATYTIQRFVTGKEYTADVFVKNKQAYCVVPRVRDEIREGLCYKAYTVPNEKFITAVNSIVSLYDFYGPINIQFIEADNGQLYCIECNPRFGGSSVTSLYAGVNLFRFILDDFENKPLIFTDSYKQIYMTRYWEEIIYER